MPGHVGAVGKSQKKAAIERMDPEMLFKMLPSEQHGEVIDQALQVTAE